MKKQRINAFLAKALGVSRRQADSIVKDGLVSVNGAVVERFNLYVSEEDDICVEGRPIRQSRNIYIALYKPVGYTTTRKDRFADKTIMDLLPKDLQGLKPAGRLDKDSEGLIFLTNDGAFAQFITSPRHLIEKEYIVWIDKRLSQPQERQFRNGIELEEGQTMPCSIRFEGRERGRYRYRVVLKEGKKRQIRRMFKAFGANVKRLLRIRIGSITLDRIRKGAFRRLTESEIKRQYVQASKTLCKTKD